MYSAPAEKFSITVDIAAPGVSDYVIVPCGHGSKIFTILVLPRLCPASQKYTMSVQSMSRNLCAGNAVGGP